MTKIDLIAKILRELRLAQTTKWEKPPASQRKMINLPPVLWIGDGRYLKATEELLNAVSAYALVCWNNDPLLKPRFQIDEIRKISARCFGMALSEIDPNLDDNTILPIIKEKVTDLITAEIKKHHQPTDLTVGCHLIEGEEPYPLKIGPATFESRELWRQRMLTLGRLSPITAQRLKARWNGKTLKKRVPSFDSQAEDAIVNAIGECPVVCVVATAGLSSKYHQEKGLLAARLAMTAVALMWNRPSEGLQWMKLLYDRRRSHRHTVLFGTGKNVGEYSERAKMPTGRYSEPELIENIRVYQWLFDQVGESLYGYVQPNQTVERPMVINAFFLSIMWFHEACREPSDQIATAKFAASMDAFSTKKSSFGIIRSIDALLGRGPDDALMTDGRTTKAVIAQIYDKGRSQLIHGSSTDYAHDWTQVRGNAEAVGRCILISFCNRVSQNPAAKNMEDLGLA